MHNSQLQQVMLMLAMVMRQVWLLVSLVELIYMGQMTDWQHLGLSVNRLRFSHLCKLN